MATRTYTQKDGTIWEWEETPELLNILAQIHNSQNNEQQKSN
jgi:hypothetical protein